jgi:hypothetical protein
VLSFQIGRDLSQLLLLIPGQIGLHVLGVASDQINASGNHDIQVDDPGAATLPFTLCCPSKFPDSARSRYHVAGAGIVNQVDGERLDAIGPNQLT